MKLKFKTIIYCLQLFLNEKKVFEIVYELD